MSLTRRHFIQGLTATGAALTLGACKRDPADPTAASTSTTSSTSAASTTSTATSIGSTSTVAASPTTTLVPAGTGSLVVVTLYGGNDSLNTVIPIGDSTYRSTRGELAIDPATAHDLGDGFALHPAMAGCKALWDAQQLAIVHGVGFHGLDRSHFHCMDVWQAGSEDDLTTGWLGRWLDAVGQDPLDAVAVGRNLPLALRGSRRSGAVVPTGSLVLPGGETLRPLLAQLTGSDGTRSPLAGAVSISTADLLSVIDTVGPILGGEGMADEETAAVPGGATGDYPTGQLAAELDVVARLIAAGLPTRVYSVSLGGFDTHANQAATHLGLLTELDAGLTSFLGRVAAHPVTVVVYSEFGRRVGSNGSAGTDHGGAGTLLVAGRVRPGFHGEPSPLDRLDDGDLATTIDFRSVYAGLLEGVLGMDAADILPGAPPALTLV